MHSKDYVVLVHECTTITTIVLLQPLRKRGRHRIASCYSREFWAEFWGCRKLKKKKNIWIWGLLTSSIRKQRQHHRLWCYLTWTWRSEKRISIRNFWKAEDNWTQAPSEEIYPFNISFNSLHCPDRYEGPTGYSYPYLRIWYSAISK